MIEDKERGNKAATPVTVTEKTSTIGPKPRGEQRRMIARETIHA
jgi:hypothetical protein